MHVLFLNEKWVRNDPTLREAKGTTISYKESGFGTHSEFHCDEYFYNHKKAWDFAIIEKVIEEKPDVIFYMWINSQYNPSLDVFSIIHKMGIPIVCWWGDFLYQGSVQNAQLLSPFISVHLIADTPIAFTQDVHSEKYKHIWPTPINQFFFRGKEEEQTTLVSFPGGSLQGGNKGPREQYIDFLKKNGVDVFVGGTRRQETTMQYADTLRKSQITINFSPRGQYGCPLKGRSFEAIWCNSLLMEPSGSFLEYHFRPYIDYIPYDDEQDLLNKIGYYSKNESERKFIANNGYQRAIQRYNPYAFWNKIFNDYLVPLNLNLNNEMEHARELLAEFRTLGKETLCNDLNFIEEIVYLIKTFDLKEFWETGSYLGYSTDFIKKLFPKMVVSSCDIHEGYLETASNNNPDVSYELKDTIDYLNDRILEYNNIPFIFLDAHGHGGGLPLEKELELIGNSGMAYILCIHDCKIPGRAIFGWDNYNVDISTELITKILSNTNCRFHLFVPNRMYHHDPLKGRCYALVNIDDKDKLVPKLFIPIEEL